MSKKIDWLENFAESYSKEIKKNTKTASRVILGCASTD